MNNLERYIRKNREQFEEDLPNNHLSNFEKKLRVRSNPFLRYRNVFAVAATIIILLSAGSVIYFSNPSKFREFIANPIQKSPLPQEVKMAMDYYNSMTNDNVKRINTLDLSQSEIEKIKTFAGQELRQYDKNATNLKRQLKRHPENELIKQALIMNQMKKNQFIKRVLKQVKETNTKEL